MEIRRITKQLKSKTSAGFDGIKVKIMKESIDVIAEPLSKILNLSLENGSEPKILKIAKICPFLKTVLEKR